MRSSSFATATVRRFLAIGLVPVVLLGAVLGMRIGALQERAVRLEHESLALEVKADVESFLAEPATALTQVAHAATDEGLSEIFAAAFADHVQSVEAVYLVDSGGRVVAARVAPGTPAHQRDLMGLDRSEDPLFISARSGGDRLVWSGVFTSSVSGRRTIAVAAPFQQGVAMADVYIESLGSAVRPALAEADTSVIITDRLGTVLFHTSDDIARQRPNYRNLRPIAAGFEGTTGEFEYTLDGTPMLGSTAIVGGAEWIVLVQQEKESALEPVRDVWIGIVVAMLGVAAAAVLAAWLFSRELSRPIAQIAEVAHAVEAGEYTDAVPEFRHKEIAELASSLAGMAAAVNAREADLKSTQAALAETVTERERALKHVSEMSAELAVAEERERRRLAEELHDRVSQVLAVAMMRLGIARDAVPVDEAALAEASRLLGEALTQTRAVTSELVPPTLYEIGLGAAVADLAVFYAEHHGLRVHVHVDGEPDGVSDDAAIALYRATRELLMNAVKHSGASEAWVELTHGVHETRLVVRDQGAGIAAEPTVSAGGFGLFSIRERLLHLGGTMVIASAPGAGYEVTIVVPCAPPPKADPHGV